MYENMGLAVADQTQISAVTPGSPADPSRVVGLVGVQPLMVAGGLGLAGYYFYPRNPVVGALIGAGLGFILSGIINKRAARSADVPEAGQEAEQEMEF